jgi:hypothetical protein
LSFRQGQGERAKISDFRVLVDRYDRAEAVRRMRTLGAELRFEAASDASYFIDPDGIVVYSSIDRQTGTQLQWECLHSFPPL